MFYAGLLTLFGAFGFYYATHLQEAPLTKRKRFLAFNAEQFRKIVDFESEAVSVRATL